MPPRNHYTPATWAAKRDATLAYCLERVRAGGRVLAQDVMASQKVTGNTATRLLNELSDGGHLVRFGEKKGWIAQGVAQQAVTLDALVAHAERHVRDDAVPARGRRNVTQRRRVEAITRAQFESARAAAGLIAEGIAGDAAALRRVGPEHLRWSEAAQEFEVVAKMGAWSDARAKARHRGPGPWKREMNDAAREKHLGGARVLLDLAATTGLLVRGVVHDVARITHYGEWQPWIEATAARLTPPGAPENTARSRIDGAATLALYATRRHWTALDQVDWDLIVADIQHDVDTDPPITHYRFSAARMVYATLRREGAISGPAWGRTRAERRGLFSTPVTHAAVQTNNFSALAAEFRGLVQGPYGLADYSTWCDARLTPAQLRKRGLPPREVVDATTVELSRAARRAARGKALYARQPSSRLSDLSALSSYAGWARDEGRFDPATQDLRVLADAALFSDYAQARVEDLGPRSTHVFLLGDLLRRMTAAFLPARAREAGDVELFARLGQHARDLAASVPQYQPKRGETADAETKVKAWSGEDGTAGDGYERAQRLVDLLIGEIEELYGAPLAQQLADLRANRLAPRVRVRWATRVRDTALIGCQLLVPLRRENAVKVREGRHWCASGDQPWEGMLSYTFTAAEYKTDVPFEAALIAAREVGNEQAEARVRRALLELLLAPGGARTILRRGAPGATGPGSLVFPPSRADTSKPWGGDGLAWMMKRSVKRYATALGLDRRALAKPGTSASHFLRHLVASVCVENGDAAAAAKLLGHGSATMTLTRYAFVNARTSTVHRTMHRTGAAAGPVAAASVAPSAPAGMKVCPECAEEVKAAARICRYCRFEFRAAA